jgi:glycerol-3-phosphate cytidylyltransferase
MGDYLMVGVSTDAFSFAKKNRYPVYTENERVAILRSLRFVDEAFFEESLELKRHYLQTYKADVLVMGDDWRGKFDEFGDICRVEYLPRTPSVSTTAIIEKIRTE